IEKINAYPSFSPSSPSPMPKQEKGTKPACALPYQLFSNCKLDAKKENIALSFESGKGNFGQKTAPFGAPFCVYTSDVYKEKAGKTWNYAVIAGDKINDSI